MAITESPQRRLGAWLWKRRAWVQACSTLLMNSWFTQQSTKGIPCLALNCYACPLAVTACPIGAIQHFVGLRQVPLYVLGVIGVAGLLGGRLACGWFCPFGWLQEWMYKLPVPKWNVQPKRRASWWVLLLVGALYAVAGWGILYGVGPTWPLFALYLVAGFLGSAFLGVSRWFALLGVVTVVPLITAEPWFCKLCPAGMLEGGIPQVLLLPSLRPLIGGFFWFKLFLLFLFLAWIVVTRRPFCRWICPLGAFWSPFNRSSSLQMRVDLDTCIRCNRCQQICPVDIRIYADAASGACVRCMQCVDVCPVSCIDVKFV